MTSRREFVVGSMVALVFVPACGPGGGSGDSGPAGPSCSSNIANNHGHVLMVPVADVMDGMDHTYDIHGTADHTHDVTITAAQFTMLMSGGTIGVPSTLVAGHMHTCMVHCTF